MGTGARLGMAIAHDKWLEGVDSGVKGSSVITILRANIIRAKKWDE
jgi:hypothetical protein